MICNNCKKEIEDSNTKFYDNNHIRICEHCWLHWNKTKEQDINGYKKAMKVMIAIMIIYPIVMIAIAIIRYR